MRYRELIEAATFTGASYWFNPKTKQIIPASDHGDAVIHDPETFDVDYNIQRQMELAYPNEGDEEADIEDQENGIEHGELPEELRWPSGSRFGYNDAWEVLGMNRGWVRVGEATRISSAYVSASTSEAVWYAVKHLLNNGGMGAAVEIEICRPTNQIYTSLGGEELDKFIKGGPKQAERLLMTHLHESLDQRAD